MAAAGVYLASNPGCPWPKFGFSTDLAERLHGDGYVLTYPRPWRFLWVFVLTDASKTDAHALEQIVFETCRSRDLQVPREDGGFTELVRADPERLKEVVRAVAEAAGLAGSFVDPASLPRTAAVRPFKKPEAAVARMRKRVEPPVHLLDGLAVPAAPAAPAAPAPRRRRAARPVAGAAAGPVAGAADPAHCITMQCEPVAEPMQSDPAAWSGGDDAPLPEADQIRLALLEQERYRALIAQLPAEGARASPLRPYQALAVAAAQKHFGPVVPGAPGRRGCWTMCCRSGKTNTALGLLERAASPGRASIYLSPWLPLIAQTAPKLALAGLGGPDSRFKRVLIVGSLPDSIPLPPSLGGAARMTTDPSRVAAFLREAASSPDSSLVISSYWSSHIIVAALSAADSPVDFVVYDEAHHLCARYDAADTTGLVPYLHMHHFFLAAAGPLALAAHQLYMTATPCREKRKHHLHMSMPDHFGPELFSYSLGAGVREGFVNPYRLVLMGGGFASDYEGRGQSRNQWPRPSLASLILQAMESPDVRRLLVKCRNVAECNALRDLCRAADVAGIEFFAVHTGTGAKRGDDRVQSVLALNSDDPQRRVVVFQCNCLSEGVELPPVNAVFVACPMASPVEIIQFVSRALTPHAGKPMSRIFLPFLFRVNEPRHLGIDDDDGVDAGDGADDDASDASDDVPDADGADVDESELERAIRARAELDQFASMIASASELERGRNWRSLGNFVFVIEALLSEDPRFFDFLSGAVDPQVSGIEWCTGTSLAAPALSREELLRYCRFRFNHCPRDGRVPKIRKNRAFQFGVYPFERGLRQLRLTTDTMRYPKTSDAFLDDPTRTASFHRWYKKCCLEYVKANDGLPSTLEPHQVAALEALPFWEEYGVYGPYSERELMPWFEKCVSLGALPAFSLGFGEQVHFDATMPQRFSGLMRIINEQDNAKGMRVRKSLVDSMDKICDAHGLQWRKSRRGGPNSPLVNPGATETFMQKANEIFRECAKDPGSDFMSTYFPGYNTRKSAYRAQEHPKFYGTPRAIPQILKDKK